MFVLISRVFIFAISIFHFQLSFRCVILSRLSSLSSHTQVGLNFQVNGRDVVVPMVSEEPSVVAGASFMAKLARTGGGMLLDCIALSVFP
jgi:hypothetical protein